jgi:hypothetical protein
LKVYPIKRRKNWVTKRTVALQLVALPTVFI